MSRERHRRATQHFLACSELPQELRADYLNEHLGDDPKLRESVEAMLRFESGHPAFLETDRPRLQARQDAAGPATIGAFRIIGRLGVGGMGTVYEAEQEHPRRRIAVKVLRGFSTPSMQRRFEFESELLGRLQHPGIAQVFEAGSAGTDEGPLPYFAMELVRGMPITQHAHAEGLSLQQRLELLCQVCAAVQHAHQRGVIHRDLKPSNILVDERGQPKVLDFGVARVTDADLQHATLRTDAGQVVGTLQYMSPEQASGDSSLLDTRADIYALGMLGFELLTGQLPYDVSRLTIAEATRVIREVEPAAPGELRAELRGDLETILLKALEKDKERRYASAADLAADIQRHLRHEPIEARPPSAAYKLAKFASRNRPLLAALIVIAASLITATAVSLNYAWSAEKQRDIALAQKTRAQERLEDVRALANTLVFDVHDSIAPLAGATPVRERLVATALAYLSKLRDQASDDLRVLADVAGAYRRVGDIQGHPRRPNLGRTEDALASYAQSLELHEQLITSGFDVAANTLAKAELLQRIGAIRTATGQHGEALEVYAQSATLLEGLAASDPRAMSAVSSAQALVGSTLEDMGRPEEALLAYQRVFDSAAALAAADPGNMGLQRDLSISCNEVGLMLERLGRYDEAAVVVERGLLIREDLAARQPDNARAQRDVALSRHRVGALALRRDDASAALVLYEAALATLQALAEADPRDNRARYDLSVALEKCAAALMSLQRASEAASHYAASLELRRELVEQNPTNQLHASAYAGTNERLARAQRAAGNFEQAEIHYRNCIALAGAVSAEHADDAHSRTSLALACHGLATLLLERPQASGAVSHETAIVAREFLGTCLKTFDEMDRRGMRPTHGELDREAICIEVDRCEALLLR